MSAKKGLDFLKTVAAFTSKSSGFDSVMKNVRITGGGDGMCTAEFTVEPEQLNRGGGLHGGFTATVVDNITTYALLSGDRSVPGVSVDLRVTYMKGAKEGDTVLVNAKTIRAGKSLAFLECNLRHKSDGSIIATGSQTKFIGGAQLSMPAEPKTP